MPLLVDAYNVLHVTGVLPPDLAGPDLDELADLIRGSRFSHARTTLVCDGSPRPGRPGHAGGGVRIVFSGPGRTADEVIVQSVRKSSDPRRLTVVTSDRAILREARKRRCETLSSEGFLRQIARDHEDAARSAPRPDPVRPDDLTPGQVRRWIDLFAVTEADLQPPAEPVPEDVPPAPAPTRPPKTVPPAPPEPPRKPLLPAALLAEAEALVRAEPPPPPPPARAPEPTAPVDAGPPGTVEPPAPLPPDDPLIPMDLLREATALERGSAPAPDAPPTRRSARPAPEPPARRPRRDVPLPSDIIAEAEALLRGESPPDDPDAPARDR